VYALPRRGTARDPVLGFLSVAVRQPLRCTEGAGNTPGLLLSVVLRRKLQRNRPPWFPCTFIRPAHSIAGPTGRWTRSPPKHGATPRVLTPPPQAPPQAPPTMTLPLLGSARLSSQQTLSHTHTPLATGFGPASLSRDRSGTCSTTGGGAPTTPVTWPQVSPHSLSPSPAHSLAGCFFDRRQGRKGGGTHPAFSGPFVVVGGGGNGGVTGSGWGCGREGVLSQGWEGAPRCWCRALAVDSRRLCKADHRGSG
jgi:hypothetical protein